MGNQINPLMGKELLLSHAIWAHSKFLAKTIKHNLHCMMGLYENMSSFQVHNIFLNELKLPNSYEESM
jgi:hypothetical protein